jgi:hypothetical protein
MTRDDALSLAGIVVGFGGIFAAICARNLRGMPRGSGASWPEPKRPKPQWMQRFGLIDAIFLLAAVGGSAIAAGLI